MTNGSIQIRSLTNGGNQCMSTFPDSSIAIENRFGLGKCLLDRSIVTVLSKLFFFSPAIIEASAIY
ncbi:toxin [Campylobacter coli]|nr:toxin [Campylobacter coli]EGS1331833.1 toxin [Campylobacter coli]